MIMQMQGVRGVCALRALVLNSAHHKNGRGCIKSVGVADKRGVVAKFSHVLCVQII